MTVDIAALPFTVPSLRAAYAAGLSPRAVVEEVFRRLEAADDPGIFISVATWEELEGAAVALGRHDADRPLWGIPVAVKDNIDAKGFATTAACTEFTYWPHEDAASVARLRAAGALIIGKANLDQFATGLVGVRTPYVVPKNPLMPGHVPGGSSSGSATSVARGIVALSLGTDTAGSGRVPAAYNNIVGLKPTFGAISARGMVPACRTLDCVSVFAHTVDDASIALAVMAGPDPADAYSRPLPASAATRPSVRIGVPRPGDRVFFDTYAEAAFDASMKVAVDLGATLVPIDFAAFFEVGTLLYGGPWVAERHAGIRTFFSEHAGDLLPVTREIIGRATHLSASDAFDGLYRLKALAVRAEAAIAGTDMLMVPSVPGLCWLDEVAADPYGANARLGTYTNFVNLLDMCALAVPAAPRPDGRPSGVTFIGRRGADAALATFGRKMHGATTATLGATGWALPKSEVPREEEQPDGWTPVMVFGAHMTDLPLNHELIREGARFLRVARTAPDYRLHLLGGKLPRPGLVRGGAGRGTSVEGEIWLLPAEGFGRFVAGVVAPLAIGTVWLDDGSSVKGFIAETEGVRGTPDISGHGSWRRYLTTAEARQPEAVR